MKYLQFVNAHQQELANFPIMWAFNKQQFEDGLKRLGLKETDEDKIRFIGNGGFIKKTDSPAFNEMMIRQAREMEEAFDDDEFAYDAFLYKLGNHEFCITYDYEPTLEALGITIEDLVADECRLMNILEKAKNDYMAGVEY